APGGHACRLYPVLHDPKFLGWSQLASAPEFGRSRIEAPADFGSLHPGSEMAAAAHLVIFRSAGGDALTIIQIRRNGDISRSNGNRALTGGLEQPIDRAAVGDIGSDVVNAGVD